MRFPLFKLLVVVALAVGVSACVAQAPMLTEASYVDRVDVELKKDVGSPSFAQALKTQARREASRYGRSGAQKELRIAVTEVHYKNALQSLMIGDANQVRAHVAVVDAATGRVHGEFDEAAVDSLAINGIAGAIISVTQDKQAAEARLAQGLASNVMEHVYGSTAAQAARQRQPVDYPETPAVAPAAPEKPAPAKRAPSVKHEPKTAMAAPAPSAVTR